jgi:hypothetical protein
VRGDDGYCSEESCDPEGLNSSSSAIRRSESVINTGLNTRGGYWREGVSVWPSPRVTDVDLLEAERMSTKELEVIDICVLFY